MHRRTVVESRRERLALARDAGFGSVSPAGVLAGTMVAYGTTVLLLAVAAAVAAGVSDDLRVDDWRTMGAGAAIVAALALFVSYTFGAYVAGRMARRAGGANGIAVFVTGIAVAVVAGFVVTRFSDGDAILADVRSLGVPTSADEWAEIGTVAGIGSLVAMLAGSLFGGMLGERWHAKLLARALDPTVGPDAATPTRPGTVTGEADSLVGRRAGDTEVVRTDDMADDMADTGGGRHLRR